MELQKNIRAALYRLLLKLSKVCRGRLKKFDSICSIPELSTITETEAFPRVSSEKP
jgi:hypothetical protein